MSTPFTYLIGWSDLNIWYSGVRYSENSNPDLLWEEYFTSSNYVSKVREEYGEPDIIEVRRIFECAIKAKEWENKVLRRMKVTQNDNWLNISVGQSVYFDPKKRWKILPELEKEKYREECSKRKLEYFAEEKK